MVTLRKSNGYTLMELLVVIAIIGVLAALIFPVASSAKRRAQEAKCMNNMMQIHTALKQFQLDERRYPEFIAGPVQFRENVDGGVKYVYHQTDTIVPLSESTGMIDGTNGGNGRAVSLFPEYITVITTLKCPFSDQNGDYANNMAWPPLSNNRPYTTGLADVGGTKVLDGKSIVEDPMYPMCSTWSSQTFRGHGRQNLRFAPSPGPFMLYKYSSYDYQKPPKTTVDEVHYSPARQDYTSGASPTGNVARQLRWRTPPEHTVVTWCSHHRTTDMSGNPVHSSKDIVLFLDGHVDKKPSDAMIPWDTNGWIIEP